MQLCTTRISSFLFSGLETCYQITDAVCIVMFDLEICVFPILKLVDLAIQWPLCIERIIYFLIRKCQNLKTGHISNSTFMVFVCALYFHSHKLISDIE